MKLNEISDNAGARKKRMRVGLGVGSGKGKTAGRGVKGQKARSGVAIKGFEGGQMPIYMRLPKRGFRKPNQVRFAWINIGRLDSAIASGKLDAGRPIDAAQLIAAGLVRRERDGVRLLAKGDLKSKITLVVAGASQAAIAAVEKAGGSVTITAPTVAAD
ncbi:50S ribosomal protein L15 [bacterium]|nr:50S ribosomal protein L15 [bacterium]